nr:DHHA1 domain-containing protein [Ectobacillus ponti]
MNRLYYQDAYLQTFPARAIRQEYDEAGRLFAVLNQTAFYPTGGGQPHDTGTLQGIAVVDVEEAQGEIRHYIADKLPKGEISGQIDWKRRFDHMQQHAGQHILSAAFSDLLGMPTVAFHLGRETVTIDLKTPSLAPEQALQAEALANQAVLENRSITARWLHLQDALALPLRKQPSVTEDIRVVIIDDFDYNGCGGTHPRSTGEVGPIKILGWERHKGNIRLEFACGWRVLRLMDAKQGILQEAVRLLNSPEQDIPEKLQLLLTAQKNTEKALQEANHRLLAAEAADLLRQAENSRIAAAFHDRSMQELAKLASLITGQHESAVVLLASKNGDVLQCVCTKGKQAAGDMNALLKEALLLINGKGGGNAASARGGGPSILTAEEFLQSLTDLLKQQTS